MTFIASNELKVTVIRIVICYLENIVQVTPSLGNYILFNIQFSLRCLMIKHNLNVSISIFLINKYYWKIQKGWSEIFKQELMEYIFFMFNTSQQNSKREYMFAVQPRDYARLSSSRNIHHSQMFTNTRGLA